MSYVFLPPALLPTVLCRYLAEHVIGQFRLLIIVAPCWIGDTWLPPIFNMLLNIPHWCPIIKSHYGYFGRMVSQGYAITAFNLLAAQ